VPSEHWGYGFGSIERTAWELARYGGILKPVHLFVALVEVPDAASRLLALRDVPGGVRAAVFGDLGPIGDGARIDWRAATALSSAKHWSELDGVTPTPAHLLIALADQGDPDVVMACDRLGVDLADARARAVAELGWSDDRIYVLECPWPAGTVDRPPLRVEELPNGPWNELQERLGHLPFGRIQHVWQWSTLRGIEDHAAWRCADRYRVDDDARYSMVRRHSDAVDQLANEKIPSVVERARQEYERELERDRSQPFGEYLTLRLTGTTRHFRGRLPVGWLTWFGNRRAGIETKWDRIRFRVTCRY